MPNCVWKGEAVGTQLEPVATVGSKLTWSADNKSQCRLMHTHGRI